MLGNETYKHAVTKMGNAAVNVLKKANLKGSDVDVFIPHQANLRIMQSTAKRAKVPLKKVYITINKYGICLLIFNLFCRIHAVDGKA